MSSAGSDVAFTPGTPPVQLSDLHEGIAQLKAGEPWQRGPRSTMPLISTPALRAVLVGLRAGAELSAHRAEGAISVQVLEGRLTFRALGQAREVAQGQLLTLETGIAHAVEAHEDTVFLLTLVHAKH